MLAISGEHAQAQNHKNIFIARVHLLKSHPVNRPAINFKKYESISAKAFQKAYGNILIFFSFNNAQQKFIFFTLFKVHR